MLLRLQNGNYYFQFQEFNGIEGLRHGIFTRLGGSSRGAYQGFNLARGVGDEAQAVAANREALSRVFTSAQLFFTQQTHGTDVYVLDGRQSPSAPPVADGHAPPQADGQAPPQADGQAPPQADGQAPPQADAEAPPQADAIVCDRPGTFAAIQVADCQAVFLVDPRRRVVANIHSGWRGSCANIIGRTISTLQERCGSRPADLLAGIGPSLGPCCGEFRHYREELPRKVWKYGNQSDHFDFWALSRDQLIAAGVFAGQIYQSRICTRCNTDLFYSYRARHDTGRFAAVIGFEAPK
jgi:YfiH family protein